MVRLPTQFTALVLLIVCGGFVGCQGTVPSLGPISLQNPVRVPPPGTGSYVVPSSYSPKQGLVPVNTNGPSPSALNSSLPSTQKTSFSGTSNPSQKLGSTVRPSTNLSDAGWHAVDSEATGSRDGAGNVVPASFDGTVADSPSVSQAHLDRMSSRLTDDFPEGMPANDATKESFNDRPPTWRIKDR